MISQPREGPTGTKLFKQNGMTDFLDALGNRRIRKINEHGDTTMGRQITVALVPLLKAGCTLRVENYGEVDAYLRVELPNASVICSDDSSLASLGFDCRDKATSPTGWMEEWLIFSGVPYAAG